jgi:hypothetical protein
MSTTVPIRPLWHTLTDEEALAVRKLGDPIVSVARDGMVVAVGGGKTAVERSPGRALDALAAKRQF